MAGGSSSSMWFSAHSRWHAHAHTHWVSDEVRAADDLCVWFDQEIIVLPSSFFKPRHVPCVEHWTGYSIIWSSMNINNSVFCKTRPEKGCFWIFSNECATNPEWVFFKHSLWYYSFKLHSLNKKATTTLKENDNKRTVALWLFTSRKKWKESGIVFSAGDFDTWKEN